MDTALIQGGFFMDELAKPRVETVEPETKPSGDVTPAHDPNTVQEGDLYATYDLDHNKPYLADYFEIGDLWNNPDLSYKDELKTIDTYLMSEIKDKTLNNSTKAVAERVAKLERLADIDPNASPDLRVRQLAAFAKYMQELNNIKLRVKFDG